MFTAGCKPALLSQSHGEVLFSVTLFEDDYETTALTAQKMTHPSKGILDKVPRGNVFIVGFFLRDLIEAVLHSEKNPP
jgi:hypothetical protein